VREIGENMGKTFQRIITPPLKKSFHFGPGHELTEGIIESIHAVSIIGGQVVVTGTVTNEKVVGEDEER
jgi:hypothetical protein